MIEGRYPIEDRELPEHFQRPFYEDSEPPLEPWSLRRRIAFGAAAAALLWAILVFALIGAVAVFGGRP